jgi:hypothetical protein
MIVEDDRTSVGNCIVELVADGRSDANFPQSLCSERTSNTYLTIDGYIQK